MILGAHESTAGGMASAFDRARRDRCETFQVFGSSSRQWAPREIAEAEVREFRRLARHAKLGPIASHACYLINLAAPPGQVRRRSLAALSGEVARCAELGIPYVILHPGSHVGSGESAGVRRVSQALDDVLAGAPRGVKVLIENTAGQGDCVGHAFAHLRDVLGAARSSRRLGVCIDTQHAFAAGHDLRTEEGYGRCFEELERAVGLERLLAFHLNDSKRPLGVRVDRHENIGLGHLGLAPFRRLVNDPRFARIPGYLETPPIDGKESFSRNLGILRGLSRR